MIVSIAKWGNSLALRIPSAFAREIDVRDGGAVDVSVDDGMLVVRPVHAAAHYDLETLLAGVTDENRHGEVGPGEALGNEL